MQPYQQRVLAERDELEKRLEKINGFIASGSFYSVPDAEKDRLNRQSHHMFWYLQVLDERIDAWSEK